MSTRSKAYLVGGGIGSLAAAAFMIRDGGVPEVSMVPVMLPADIPCAADAC